MTRLFAWLWLAGRDSAAKDVEILMLRHQLAVAPRRDPRVARKLTWTDRAWLVLLAGLLPTDRVSRLRLIVTSATLLRWHRDLLRRRWARRSRRRAGRPSTHRNIKALVLRNGHRPHRSLDQAAPMRPRPDNVVDLEEFRVRRRDRAGGLLHEYQRVA